MAFSELEHCVLIKTLSCQAKARQAGWGVFGRFISAPGLLPRLRQQGLVESMIDEADSGRCRNEMESRRLGDSSLHRTLQEASPEWICRTRPLSALWDALWSWRAQGRGIFIFWSFLDSYPLPRLSGLMCHGQIMTSEAKYLNTGWEEGSAAFYRSAFC